jgi:tight adherence protein B
MRALLIAVVIVAGVALLEGGYFFARYLADSRRDELRRRLQSLGGGPQSVSLLRQGRLSVSPTLDAVLRAFAVTARIESLIEQADLPYTVARLLTFCGVAGGSALLLASIARQPLPLVVLAAIAGSMTPILFVLNARARRTAKLSEQLPEALDMMARSLRAGHALSAAFRLVAAEMPEPINLEFGRAFEEQNLGLPFERAVENMTRRAPNNRDLKIFAVSVNVQKETGGNLAEILEQIADTIRSRYRFYGKLRALTAESRASAYVLGALPCAAGLAIYAFNPSYARILVDDPLGRGFLVYAIVTWIVGFAWMNRMAKVEF